MTFKVYNNCIHRLNLRKVTPAVNLAIIALTIIPCVSAQESIQHELPIVTHRSNETNAELSEAQTPFIVAKPSDAGVTTHEITSGNVTLGITDKGGGMINKFTLPGYGDISDDVADLYGRGGQVAVRDAVHKGWYNPTQAGHVDGAGTQCNITATTGKLVVDKRPCSLWRGDGKYDFIEWEDLTTDNYNNDGGTSGHNSDVDGIDETNLVGKQATEITSEFDFYCEYQDYMDSSGVDIPCFRYYYEFEFARYPGHCLEQFNESTPCWWEAMRADDISVKAPSGTHQGTYQDMNRFIHGAFLRNDNDIWAGNYRHLKLASGAWYTEARNEAASVSKEFLIHPDLAEAFPLLIISNSTDINSGPAIGVFQPWSEINVQQTVGGTYTDDRRMPDKMVIADYPNRAGQNKFGFRGRTWGLLNRNRTPNNDPEMWRGEMYILVGTPAEIYANALKLNGPGGDPEYTLTVNSGTGDGYYTEGIAANIVANAPAAGYIFDQWTGDVANVADVNAASTTITMPAANTTVTATYKLIPDDEYTLTVNSGTGDGSYTERTDVNIVADPPAAGYTFDQWTGDVANVANLTAASTTITMPAANRTVTATYKLVPDDEYTLTVNSGSGDGSYTERTDVNIVANAPAAGYTFDQWTGDVANVANVTAASTTITMPAANITVTATYLERSSGDPNVVLGWDFETGDQGWIKDPRRLSVSASNGKLDCTVSGADPYVSNTTSPTFSTSNINYLEVKVKNSTSNTSGQIILWAPTSFPINYTMTANSPYYETIIVDLSTVSNWSNSLSVTNMRLDPNTPGTSGLVSYDHVYWVQDYSKPTSYSLTVNSGTGDGDYEDGTDVPIVADPPAAGYVFDKWTGDVANVADVNAAKTTISMPAEAVELTATYTPANSTDLVRASSMGSDVQLYPNPARGIINIKTTDAFEVVVFYAVGQTMYNKHYAGNSCNIDVSKWKSGVYFVNIQCDGKVYNRKLIVE